MQLMNFNHCFFFFLPARYGSASSDFKTPLLDFSFYSHRREQQKKMIAGELAKMVKCVNIDYWSWRALSRTDVKTEKK